MITMECVAGRPGWPFNNLGSENISCRAAPFRVYARDTKPDDCSTSHVLFRAVHLAEMYYLHNVDVT
jgi:hypothetical protein